MNTKSFIPAVLMGLALFTTSCGSKADDKNENSDTPRAAVLEDTQGAQKEDDNSTYDVKVGERDYKIGVHRYSDTEKPAMKDEFGDEFYDNRIAVTIRRDTAVVAEREFSLESFESYIPNKYKGKVILQGMAPDEQRSTANGIVFGVSIGAPGTDEGQIMLLLTIVPGSGSIDIQKDDTPDSTGADQGTDSEEN